MKKINYSLFVLLVSAISFAACGGESPAKAADDVGDAASSALSGDMNVNLDNSKVMWKGEMMGMYAHEGTVNISEAKLNMKDGQITGGSFAVDMSSITPTDENYKPEEGSTKEKLVGHLSSPDFFDVANHAKATFEVASVSGNTATGTLTVRGKSNEETVKDIVISPTENGAKVTGMLVFDRTKYDVTFTHPVKEMVLSNDIALNIELEAGK